MLGSSLRSVWSLYCYSQISYRARVCQLHGEVHDELESSSSCFLANSAGPFETCFLHVELESESDWGTALSNVMRNDYACRCVVTVVLPNSASAANHV